MVTHCQEIPVSLNLREITIHIEICEIPHFFLFPVYQIILVFQQNYAISHSSFVVSQSHPFYKSVVIAWDQVIL
jgi:hypothetical protein